MKTLRPVNTTGLGIKGEERDKIQDIRVFHENGSVQLWVELHGAEEYLQYLSPEEAMILAKALDRLAIEAFRERARY